MESTTDVANRGLIRPPLVYSLTFLLGLLAHWYFPKKLIGDYSGTAIGVALIAVGIALLFWSVYEFRAANTAVPGNQATTAIVDTGPFSFSRNPIYVAFTLIQIGASVWFNSFWFIFSLLVSILIMSFVVIPREERYLLNLFSDEYTQYKRAVRRWL